MTEPPTGLQRATSNDEFTRDLSSRDLTIEDIAAAVRGLDGITAFPGMPFSGVVLTGDGDPEELETGYVSDAFFTTLDVTMLLGRGFRPDEDEPDSSPDRISTTSPRQYAVSTA